MCETDWKSNKKKPPKAVERQTAEEL